MHLEKSLLPYTVAYSQVPGTRHGDLWGTTAGRSSFKGCLPTLMWVSSVLRFVFSPGFTLKVVILGALIYCVHRVKNEDLG